MNRQKRQSIKHIKEVKNLYDKGLKIYNLLGQLIYTGRPGFSVDYQELIRQTRRKVNRSRPKGYNEYKGKRGSF